MAGALYLVATPIGDPDDITLRALAILRSADLIVSEERREGERLLRRLGIAAPLETLNEHNEHEATDLLLERLQQGAAVALVSDCGTPVFSDPGRFLVARAAQAGIRIIPVPGASALLPALTVSGFPIDRFLFYGWLSPKKEERRAELRDLAREPRTVVLMDTPYRLMGLLRDLASAFGEGRRICLAYNLTLPDEQIFRGTAPRILSDLGGRELKGEFVVVIDGSVRKRRS
jgi:16S rRNA (cytidine1402-2'-O)-methyltransferase